MANSKKFLQLRKQMGLLYGRAEGLDWRDVLVEIPPGSTHLFVGDRMGEIQVINSEFCFHKIPIESNRCSLKNKRKKL